MAKRERNWHPSALTIHELIEENAARTPEAMAISVDGITLTYKELNEKSNQLAHLLLGESLQDNPVIGICVDRSIEMIIGVLGILKAGAAYIPIDPHYPKERIHFMLADSQIATLLTQQHLQAKFTNYIKNTIFLDVDTAKVNAFPKTNPRVIVSPESLAYVLYTSGSTGKPKGVMVTHGNVMHAYNGWKAVYDLTRDDCHLQMANFSFDVFTGDLIRALGSGGKLVVCPRESLLEPEKLYHLMVTEKVNCAEFVPTVMRRMIEYIELKNQSLDFMRLVICGSDNWSMHEYRQLQHLCGKDTRVINSYGVTEATIDSTFFEASLLDNEGFNLDHAVPIGKPFPNTDILLLDENQQVVPHGEMGEIHIGGAGLARGYWNRSDLTSQKFIKHPFSTVPNARLYKTGDLARYLPDANIEFLGRMDTQVKLRGMRIELSDIENVINCHSDIRESLVVIHENQELYKQLVAYIILEENAELHVVVLRKFLEARLPNYMIPAFFISLDALPLTPNGKLDRQALSAHKLLLPEHNFIAPRNALESQLTHIWKRLLHIEKIGIQDGFSDLGGDSILFANLITEIESTFAVKIDKCSLSMSLTIEELAKIINNQTSITHLKNDGTKSCKLT